MNTVQPNVFRWTNSPGPPQAHLLESDDNRLNQRYRYLLIQSQVNQSIYQWHIWRNNIYATNDKQRYPQSQCTLTSQFTHDLVSTLRLHSYMLLVSLTPLERLIENGSSLPASKHVSGTQARSRIEGVWLPWSLQHQRLGLVLSNFPMAVDLPANG